MTRIIISWSSAHVVRNILYVRTKNVPKELFEEENVTRILCYLILLIWKITKEIDQTRQYCYSVPTFRNLFSLNKSLFFLSTELIEGV